jgi:hypothetical protein
MIEIYELARLLFNDRHWADAERYAESMQWHPMPDGTHEANPQTRRVHLILDEMWKASDIREVYEDEAKRILSRAPVQK